MSWLDPLLAIKTQQAGTTAGTRQTINFASGATVTDDPANDRVNVAIAGGLPGVTVTGTPTAGQTVVASSASAAAWGSVPRGNVANTSGAVGDLITGDATTLGRLAIGSTGQVLTVSGGAPVWATASPSLIWEADFTSGQTAQSWTAGSTYAVVGSSGTGNINFKHNGGTVPNSVAMVAASGLEVTYATGTTSPSSSVNIDLSQLSIGYLLGRPWRVWMYYTYSGSITAGSDNQNICVDLDGTGATNSSTVPTNFGSVYRIFNSSGNAFAGTTGFGTNYEGAPGSAYWYSADVLVITSVAGHISAAWGSWSSGFPSITAMRGMNAGSIQQAAINPTTPYAANSALCFRVASGGATTMTSRKVIIKAMKFEGL